MFDIVQNLTFQSPWSDVEVLMESMNSIRTLLKGKRKEKGNHYSCTRILRCAYIL